MDILNWLYLVKNKFTRTTIENPATDLVVLGADVSYAKRGDKYQNYAIPAQDFCASCIASNTAFYTMRAGDNYVEVSTQRGIIEVIDMGTAPAYAPLRGFSSSYQFVIDNPALNLTPPNRDNIYVQYSVYYSQGVDDNAIPYLISTGFVTNGLEFNLYNANPALDDTGNWQGSLYIYYELYEI